MNNTLKKLLINLLLAAMGILLVLTRDGQGTITLLRSVVCMAYCLYLFIWITDGIVSLCNNSQKNVKKETV